mmetsp:Transcript_87299/g.273405  ORF Transcript_87299/g.273405 Transcript_87299/m.273405 type:complete len:260 (+) Transcript_87299:459-1238(+)
MLRLLTPSRRRGRRGELPEALRQERGRAVQLFLLALLPQLGLLQELSSPMPVALGSSPRAVHQAAQTQGGKLVAQGLLDGGPGFLRTRVNDVPLRLRNPWPDGGEVKDLLERWAILGVPVQHGLDQGPGARAAGRSDWRVVALDDLQREAVEALGVKRALPVDNFVEDAPKAPDVALVAVGLVVDQLRGHVEGSANLRLGELVSGVEHRSDAKVAKLEGEEVLCPVTRQEDVLRLQISMQDLLEVQRMQSQGNLDKPLQ